MEVAVVRVGPGMNAQDISNTVLAYGKLGLMPGAAAWAALEAAVVRVGPCGMNAQAVANTLWELEKELRVPGQHDFTSCYSTTRNSQTSGDYHRVWSIHGDLDRIWQSRCICWKLKGQLFSALVLTVLLYNAEVWPLMAPLFY